MAETPTSTPHADATDARRRHERLALAAILVGFALLCLWVAVKVPFKKPPDENRHAGNVKHVAETGDWRADIRQLPPGSEAHQPPLYYLLAAQVWRLTGRHLTPVRLLSSLFGLVAIWLTVLIGRKAFPDLPLVPLAAGAVVAFLPMNLYLSAVCNNDELATMLVALGFLMLLRATGGGMTLGSGLGLGLVCGLAMMAKSTALCLFVGTVAALLLLPAPGRSRLLWVAAATAGMLAVAGPWLLRNMLVYGDPLAGRAIVMMSPSYSASWLALSPYQRLAYAFRPTYLWTSFWGAFGAMALPRDFLPNWAYGALTGWLGLALVGLVRGAGGLWRTPAARTLGTALLAGGITLLAGFISLNLMVFQAQGRYFFALLAPLAIVLCAGLYHLGGERWGRWLPVGFVGCLLGVAIYAAQGAML
jgi:4-amino-4-deoxy-L-arabinose transferase-like glycosyltransferase